MTWDDSAAALAVVARRLSVPADEADIGRRLASREAPTSLLALVEVAAELGLHGRGVRADLAALERLSLPAVLHVRNPLGDDDQGFVALVGHDAQGFALEGNDGPTMLEPEELTQLWTGVAVTFARSDGRAAAPPMPESGGEAGGTTTSSPVRLAIAIVGAIAIVELALTTAGVARGAAAIVWMALAALGAVAAREALLRARFGEPSAAGRRRFADRFCARGRVFDCQAVLGSRWAAPFGLDLGGLGLAFFAASLALLALGAALPAASQRGLHGWLALAHLVGAPLSLFLIGAQLLPRPRLCPLCLVAHAALLGGAGAGAWLMLSGGAPLPSLTEVAPFAVVHALGFLVAYTRLVPATAAGEEARRSAERLRWVEASSWGALAELRGRPAVTGPGPRSPVVLGDPATGVRIDVVVDPRCPACKTALAELEVLVARHPTLAHVLVHEIGRTPDAGLEALVASLPDLIPQVVVQGKRWERPLWQLDLVIGCHGDRLLGLGQGQRPESGARSRASSQTLA